jgi:hypothetical protein
MAAGMPSGHEVGNRSEINEGNVMGITFEDLSEGEQHRIKEEMRRELEEVEAAKMCEKLACY